MVVPAVLDLYKNVTEGIDKVRYLRKMLVTLRDFLKRRFLGIFIRVEMAYSDLPNKQPFYSRAYFAAALLDPNLKLSWIDLDVKVLADDADMDPTEAAQSLNPPCLQSTRLYIQV